MEIITTQKKIKIDEEILSLSEIEKESCTIVHCKYAGQILNSHLRIWLSTYLIEEDKSRKKLIKAFNIAMMPKWSIRKAINGFYCFTLVFEGLSKHCQSFYLLEDIPEPGGFYSKSIERNNTDVYSVEVNALQT